MDLILILAVYWSLTLTGRAYSMSQVNKIHNTKYKSKFLTFRPCPVTSIYFSLSFVSSNTFYILITYSSHFRSLNRNINFRIGFFGNKKPKTKSIAFFLFLLHIFIFCLSTIDYRPLSIRYQWNWHAINIFIHFAISRLICHLAIYVYLWTITLKGDEKK